MTEIWLAFLAGLAGSPHCVGMCGGIVAAIGMAGRRGAVRSCQLFQLFCNLGRVSTYCILGVAAGAIGPSLDFIAVRDMGFWFLAGANLFVLLVGLSTAMLYSALSISSVEGRGGRLLAGPMRWALAGDSPLRAYPLGVILGFLPCGLVYAPLVAAAGSGSPLRGGVIMAALGLGTVPILLSFGSAAALFSGRMRENLFRCTGVILALMGCAGLWRAMGKMGYVAPFPFW